MKDSIILKWKDGMAFETEVDGFIIKLDAKEDQGGKNQGPRPKPLMMVSLAGCTGMDVVSVLKKMRVGIVDFSIKIVGDITEEHPKHFTKMHIIYTFEGPDLPLEKLEKAIKLSQERYCGVSATYRKAMDITYEIKIVH
jgi:putative redox protein